MGSTPGSRVLEGIAIPSALVLNDIHSRGTQLVAILIMPALIPPPKTRVARHFPVPHDHLRRSATGLARSPGPAYD